MRDTQRAWTPNQQRGPRPQTYNDPWNQEGHRRLSEIHQGEQGLPETGGLANPIETTPCATDA